MKTIEAPPVISSRIFSSKSLSLEKNGIKKESVVCVYRYWLDSVVCSRASTCLSLFHNKFHHFLHSIKSRNNILVAILPYKTAKCCHLFLFWDRFKVVVVFQSRICSFGFETEFFQGVLFSYPSVKNFFIIIKLFIESVTILQFAVEVILRV